jgi:hypothetical protein
MGLFVVLFAYVLSRADVVSIMLSFCLRRHCRRKSVAPFKRFEERGYLDRPLRQ